MPIVAAMGWLRPLGGTRQGDSYQRILSEYVNCQPTSWALSPWWSTRACKQGFSGLVVNFAFYILLLPKHYESMKKVANAIVQLDTKLSIWIDVSLLVLIQHQIWSASTIFSIPSFSQAPGGNFMSQESLTWQGHYQAFEKERLRLLDHSSKWICNHYIWDQLIQNLRHNLFIDCETWSVGKEMKYEENSLQKQPRIRKCGYEVTLV